MPSNENIPSRSPATSDPKKEKPGDALTRKVEEALIDQDIPVETGVRPNNRANRDTRSG